MATDVTETMRMWQLSDIGTSSPAIWVSKRVDQDSNSLQCLEDWSMGKPDFSLT